MRRGFADAIVTSLLAAGLIVLALRPEVARADAAAEARFHDELARDHYAARRWEEALREFFLEQRVAPNPRISFNIALCFQQLHRDDDAFGMFTEYLRSSDEDPERRRFAQTAVAELEQRVARVRVESEPAGATVYVDRAELGAYCETPCVIPVSPGEHTFLVDRDGYVRTETRASARRGAEETLRVALDPVLGTLRVTCTAAARATIRTPDGEVAARDVTPLDARLRPGQYEVEVIAEGFAPYRSIRTVEAGTEIVVAADVDRLPEPAGQLAVTSNIAGALVEIDGESVGYTPTTLSLRAGRHRFTVLADDVDPLSSELTIEENERSWVTVTLEPPLVYERSPLTWLLGAGGVIALAAGTVLAVLATTTHDTFEDRQAAGLPTADLVTTGRTLSFVADALFYGGGISLGTSVLLYFATERSSTRRSSATVTNGGS